MKFFNKFIALEFWYTMGKLCYYGKKLWYYGKKTMVLWKKLWYYEKKPWYYTENYETLIYYGKNDGSMEKKLWYYRKLLFTTVNYSLLWYFLLGTKSCSAVIPMIPRILQHTVFLKIITYIFVYSQLYHWYYHQVKSQNWCSTFILMILKKAIPLINVVVKRGQKVKLLQWTFFLYYISCYQL